MNVSSFISCAAAVAFLSTQSIADITANKELKGATKEAATLLQRMSLNKTKIDDKISERTFKLYLKHLDSKKSYFTQADITEFEAFKTEIDDEIRAGSLKFLELVHERYITRLKERNKLVEESIIPKITDFTADESLSLDYDARNYTNTPEELAERVRLDTKATLLTMQLIDSKLSLADAKKKLISSTTRSAAQTIARTDMEVMEEYLGALTHAFDPHSDYMSPDTLREFQIEMSLKLAGIGASLREDGEGHVIVEELVAGGPAALDGTIKKGDQIAGVASDGKIENIVEGPEFGSLPLNKKVKLIRGDLGTKVTVRVLSGADATAPAKDLTLTRAEIKVDSEKAVGEVKDVTSEASSTKYKVGQIYLPGFYRDFEGCQTDPANCMSSTNDVQNLIESKDFEGIDLLVLDLRNNGGGALTDAIGITGLFIDKGPVVQVKDGRGVKVLGDGDAGVVYSGPLVVLINQGSASASEIVAGTLQDYARALVIGGDSFGKGTVQNVVPVIPAGNGLLGAVFGGEPQGALKLTIQEFYRVNGASTQEIGVVPDVKLPTMMSVLYPRESELDHALKNSTIKAAEYDKVTNVTSDIQTKVKSLSEARRLKSTDFDKLTKDIEQAKTRKADKTISLSEEKRKKAAAEAKDEEEGLAVPDAAPLIEVKSLRRSSEEPKQSADNFYNRELLQISVDYLEASKKAE